MNNTLLYEKLNLLPENLQQQVLDYVEFLLERKNKKENGQPLNKRKFGSGKGMFEMIPGFDEPLDDFKEYME